MKLNQKAKELFLKHKDRPLVGLINRNTKEIVLAPCITPKVSLKLDKQGLATSGYLIDEELNYIAECTARELQDFNALLGQGFVPRLANTPLKENKSAHEFLFEQQCSETSQTDWGGFSVLVNSEERLDIKFSSATFNSPPRKRIRGAEVEYELRGEIIKQIQDSYIESATEKPLSEEFESDNSNRFFKRAKINLTPLHEAAKEQIATLDKELQFLSPGPYKEERQNYRSALKYILGCISENSLAEILKKINQLFPKVENELHKFLAQHYESPLNFEIWESTLPIRT